MALLLGPAVALLGIFAAFIVLRTRARTQQSLYSARRTLLEERAQERRERALAPEPPPQPVPAGPAPAMTQPPAAQLAVAAPVAAPEPATPEPAAPAPPPAWDRSPVPPVAATVPVPTFESTAAVEPPPVETPAITAPSQPEPEPEHAADSEPAGETKENSAGWSIVEPASKETPAGGSARPVEESEDKQPAWDIVPHQRHERDQDFLLAQPPSYSRHHPAVQTVLSYAVLVGALVVVLLGVLLMLATSR